MTTVKERASEIGAVVSGLAIVVSEYRHGVVEEKELRQALTFYGKELIRLGETP